MVSLLVAPGVKATDRRPIAAFFSANFLKNITLFTTSIMSFSFAFAGTVQEFAGSVIFLFVKHPYDIGDRVEVG